MTWREDLRRVTIDGRTLVGASFRGVPFFVDEAERQGGRRAVVHEFPLREDPYVEDLGKRAGTVRISGYVIGDDYLAQRDALVAALQDTAGPGQLIHPYEGTLRAVCVGLSMRTSTRDGGMAMLAIDFAEAPAQLPSPTEVKDPAGAVASLADTALEAIDAELVDKYDADGMPSFSLASAEEAITKAAASLGETLGPIVQETQELAVLTGRVALLTAQASSLVRSPASIVDEFQSTVAALIETALAAPGAVLDALMESYLADLGVPAVATTATRARELANQNALTGALRRVMVIEAARLAPRVEYTSIEDATEARDTIAAALEEQSATADDAAYTALANLRSEVLRSVPGSEELARIVTITRAEPVPSVLLAYQLYGSVALEGDLVARNKVKHPGFVAGELKALSDDR